jgi:death-on-curing protein
VAKRIDFLDVADVIALHALQIERFGGSAGVRDQGLLDSAVAAPAATFDGEYLHATLFEMGAAYLFHLCKNHPFVDGNKRVALHAALVFLELNGVRVEASNEALVELVLGVAGEGVSKSAVAVFLERHRRRTPPKRSRRRK